MISKTASMNDENFIYCLEVVSDIDEIELVGLITCGGCPGKKISLRVKSLLEEGADKVVLTSCMTKGTCRDEVCPHLDAIKESVLNLVDEDKVIFSTL